MSDITNLLNSLVPIFIYVVFLCVPTTLGLLYSNKCFFDGLFLAI